MWAALTLSLLAAPALANDEDKAACEALAEGDACVDHKGRDGECIPDTDEPNVLTCESLEDLDGTDDNGGQGGGTDDTGFDDNNGNGSGGGSADKAACDGLVRGDACVDHNDRDGTCVPDISDPGTLTCESNEDVTGTGSNASSVVRLGASGCSHTGTGLAPWAAALGLLLLRRRSRH